MTEGAGGLAGSAAAPAGGSAEAPAGAPAGHGLRWALVGVVVLAGALVTGISVGPVSIPAGSVARELLDRLPFVHVDSGLDAQSTAILWDLRAPRVVLGALVGAALALSGCAYQGVFRNPLADPYLLGAAAGAGLGATLAIANRSVLADLPFDALPPSAFLGALAGVAAAYALGRTAGAGRGAGALVLAGVAVASFLTALQTWVLQRNADTLREVYDWILGRLTTSDWGDVRLALPYLVVAGAALLAHRRLLDVLRVGDEEAGTLGVDVGRLRLTVVVAASLLTAAAVAVSGLIAFVGIIVPHLLRLTTGASYRRLLPLSALFGAAFLVLADVAARTLASPAEIPIGVITAFVGAPFFAIVLATSKRTVW